FAVDMAWNNDYTRQPTVDSRDMNTPRQGFIPALRRDEANQLRVTIRMRSDDSSGTAATRKYARWQPELLRRKMPAPHRRPAPAWQLRKQWTSTIPAHWQAAATRHRSPSWPMASSRPVPATRP